MTTLTLICGGRSAEHEISLMSTHHLLAEFLAMPEFSLQLIYITQAGEWRYMTDVAQCAELTTLDAWINHPAYEAVTPILGHQAEHWLTLESPKKLYKTDVVFPVMHGEHAEDGDLQGLLELMDVPYVGSKVLGSAMCMDKVVSKELLAQMGISVPVFLWFYNHEAPQYSFEHFAKLLGTPFFIKPANTGSSLGVAKVHRAEEYNAALEAIFELDEKVIVEQAIHGRELEVGVLGDHRYQVSSVAGEIRPSNGHEFYDYDAKYFDDAGAELIVPANVSALVLKDMQTLARAACRILNVRGLARVDFLLDQNECLYVNEINTLPGFTSISMYTKVWQASGLKTADLLRQLVALALQD